MPDGGEASTYLRRSWRADDGADTRILLRILATTDMHMHVLPYDYLTNQPSEKLGLARTASLIARRRAEVGNCLLLDNGDFLQGSPMGDYAASVPRGMRPGARHGAAHPAIAAMNALGYDAAALGNHDFSYGLPFLRNAVAGADFPVLAANLRIHRGPDFPGHVILDRRLRDQGGGHCDVRIGIVGFLPPQTAQWDRDLSAWVGCDDIVETALRILPRMRAEGAQLIVALAHSGIGPRTPRPMMENAATALAGLPGVDAVIAGHTHGVFPDPQAAPQDGVDPRRGSLMGKPAVMAGFGGSHLGIIDLDLRADGAGGLHVARFETACEPVAPELTAAPEIARPVLPAHRGTLRQLRRKIGRSGAPLHSYFALIGQDHGVRLVNMAQRWHVRRRLKGSRWQDLPVLSATAPFRAGGLGGPGHYTDIPAGPLSLRNIADLYPFPNRICAIQLDGARLQDWLERAASLFLQVQPGSHDAALIDPGFPSYNFDVIDGVSWDIDLSQPARYAPDGQLRDPASRRVRHLRRQDRRIAPDDRFVLATNLYRLASCGLFGALASSADLVLEGDQQTRDILCHYIRRRRLLPPMGPAGWSFAPMPGTSALFRTGPGAMAHLDALPARLSQRIAPAGHDPEGFAILRLSL